MNRPLHGLYLVTPDWDDTHRLIAVSRQALQGGARILQYRHKTADARLRREQATALQQLCRDYPCLFIINDHDGLGDSHGARLGGQARIGHSGALGEERQKNLESRSFARLA